MVPRVSGDPFDGLLCEPQRGVYPPAPFEALNSSPSNRFFPHTLRLLVTAVIPSVARWSRIWHGWVSPTTATVTTDTPREPGWAVS